MALAMDEYFWIALVRAVLTLVGYGIIVSQRLTEGMRQLALSNTADAVAAEHTVTTDGHANDSNARPLEVAPDRKGAGGKDLLQLLMQRQPATQWWIVGHVVAMLASSVASFYLIISIAMNGFYGLEAHEENEPTWEVIAYWIRDSLTVMVTPLSLLQPVLIAYRRYSAHRWLGRALIHLWFLISICTFLIGNSMAAFISMMAAVLLEASIYFTIKYRKECSNYARVVATNVRRLSVASHGGSTRYKLTKGNAYAVTSSQQQDQMDVQAHAPVTVEPQQLNPANLPEP